MKKRKQKPDLVPDSDETVRKIKDVETLKSGKLARLAIQLAGHLVETFGPRPSCGQACQDTAEALEKEYQPFCDEVHGEDEELKPEAMHLPLRVLPYLYPVLLVLLWVGLPLTATLLSVAFVLLSFSQSFRYRPVLERWVKPKKGRNVWASINPSGPVRHTIIFSGHHDSAPLTRFSKDDKWQYAKSVLLPVGLCLLLAIQAVVQTLTELFSGRILSLNLPPAGLIILLALLTAGLPLVFRLRKFFTGEFSPGAGDNLVSSALTVELARYVDWKKRCGQPLSATRVVFASFDGEEDGLLGSRAWFFHHKDLLEGDVVMLNFDCLYYADRLMFLEKDINGLQPLSSKLARRMVGLAKEMGYPAKSGSIPFLAGGTDAAEGARAGIQACTLVAVGWGDRSHAEVYHTSEDTVDHIEEKAVEEAVSLGIKLVELVDEDRLFSEGEEKKKPEPEPQTTPTLRFKRSV